MRYVPVGHWLGMLLIAVVAYMMAWGLTTSGAEPVTSQPMALRQRFSEFTITVGLVAIILLLWRPLCRPVARQQQPLTV